MTYAWSELAPHIHTLFRPWQENDGYTEATVRAAEVKLGLSLPTTLRSLYRSWGRRDDMLRFNDYILPPDDLFTVSDTLVFCSAHPGSSIWAVSLAASLDNPPVYYGDVNYPTPSSNRGVIELGSLSHDHLSDFLDALIYSHAFCGGALHGGWSREQTNQQRKEVLEQGWDKIIVNSAPWGLSGNALPRRWPLYIRDGQVIDCPAILTVAARTEADLNAIAQALDVTWDKYW